MSEPATPDRPGTADEAAAEHGIPNPETGVGIGAGEPSTFEPEEDAPEEDAPEDGGDDVPPVPSPS